MVTFAEMSLPMAAAFGWALVGLLAGKFAGKLFGPGGYGAAFDFIAGVTGALAGAFLFDMLKAADTSGALTGRFVESLVVAGIGACVGIFGGRMMGLGQRS